MVFLKMIALPPIQFSIFGSLPNRSEYPRACPIGDLNSASLGSGLFSVFKEFENHITLSQFLNICFIKNLFSKLITEFPGIQNSRKKSLAALKALADITLFINFFSDIERASPDFAPSGIAMK